MTRTVSGLLLCDVKQGPDLRFRSLHDREKFLSSSFQKIKVSSLVTHQVLAAEEVCIEALCTMNYLQCGVRGAHQVKRFSRAQADGEMGLYSIVGIRWSVPEGFPITASIAEAKRVISLLSEIAVALARMSVAFWRSASRSLAASAFSYAAFLAASSCRQRATAKVATVRIACVQAAHSLCVMQKELANQLQ